MIKTILLPVDGSEYTSAVLSYGIALAKKFAAKIKVLSVIDIRMFEWALSFGSDGFVPLVPSTSYQEQTKELLENKSAAIVDKSKKILQNEAVEFETEIVHGSPIEIITEQSDIVDLIIMGNRGEYARWKSKMIGATLEAVTRQINKPIFITPIKYADIANILVAYDGSELSTKALQIAGYFGCTLNVSLTVLTITDDKDWGDRIRKKSEKYLEPYKLACNCEVLPGDVEDEILRFANKNKMDLLIMGAYGHSRIREAILGSTTAQIMRNADIPVLLAK